MDAIILIGVIIFGVGLLLLMLTTKFVYGRNWGYPYRTTNKPLAALGWFLLIIGFLIMIFKAKANGQIG